MTARVPPVVMKFGGRSLAAPELVVERVRAVRAQRKPVVVVVSAAEGVTDRLLRILDPTTGPRRRRWDLDRIRAAYPHLSPAGGPLWQELTSIAARLDRGEPVDRERGLSLGERLSARWIAGHLRRAKVPAVPLDADTLGLEVIGTGPTASIPLGASATKVASVLRHELSRRRTPVVTGYFGRRPGGGVTTLGRGGSDYSAAVLGVLLGAERIELTKSDFAIHSADPDEVSDAVPIRALTYGEAEELARFGGRVLHPRTIGPARRARIPIWVRSLLSPGDWTVIGPQVAGGRHRLVTRSAGVAVVARPDSLDRDAPGRETPEDPFASSSLARFPTEDGWSFAVLEGSAAPSSSRATDRADVVTVVGEGVAEEVGRVPASLRRYARGLTASPRSISLLVPRRRGIDALRRLHQAFVRGSAPGRPWLGPSPADRTLKTATSVRPAAAMPWAPRPARLGGRATGAGTIE